FTDVGRSRGRAFAVAFRDRPHRLVCDDRFCRGLPRHTGERGADLALNELKVRATLGALMFAHTYDRHELFFQQEGDLFVDIRVGFAHRAAFGVTNDDTCRTKRAEHRHRNLAGVRADLFRMDVLCAKLDALAHGELTQVAEIRRRRGDDY